MSGLRVEQLVADRPPVIAVRIPGDWHDPGELRAGLPGGVTLLERQLTVGEDPPLTVSVLPCDPAFPDLFNGTLDPGLDAGVRRRIESSRVLVCLITQGGSVAAVERIGRGVSALMEAGGYGMFVDNSGAACLPDDWKAMGDAPFMRRIPLLISRVRSEDAIFSIGMHIAGLRDATIARSSDFRRDLLDLGAFLEYSCEPAGTICEGDLVGDAFGPQFQVWREPVRFPPPGSAMHNPYGRWRLEPWDEEM